MSELSVSSATSKQSRYLANASAMVLAAALASATGAHAEDRDAHSLWIELGGDFNHLDGQPGSWSPTPNAVFDTSGSFVLKSPPFDFGGEAGITYRLNDTGWLAGATIRLGRSGRHPSFHTATSSAKYPDVNAQYANSSHNRETHLILDFKVGKDVGLGAYGLSVVSVGLRYAQQSLDTDSHATYDPKDIFGSYYGTNIAKSYSERARIQRSAWAIGPAVSWDASAALAESSNGQFALDWGVNAALLVGRQKFSGQYSSTYVLKTNHRQGTFSTSTTHSSSIRERSRMTVTPNIGAFAGFSYKWPSTRVS
ncbi:MAG TPA: hypothetical protein VG897_16270, partial [Terriglobales bacterium]|nr:hypothetical protein [Terriglobales bacterium]